MSAATATANPLFVSPNRAIASPRLNFFTMPKLCVAASVQAFADVQVASESRRSSASFYDVLRVKHNASSMEIKTAYRSLAKLYHPDSLQKPECDSNGRSFIEIHNAYETLSDPATRADYDLTLAALSRRSYLYSVGNRIRSRPHRRWETDQCW